MSNMRAKMYVVLAHLLFASAEVKALATEQAGWRCLLWRQQILECTKLVVQKVNLLVVLEKWSCGSKQNTENAVITSKCGAQDFSARKDWKIFFGSTLLPATSSNENRACTVVGITAARRGCRRQRCWVRALRGRVV